MKFEIVVDGELIRLVEDGEDLRAFLRTRLSDKKIRFYLREVLTHVLEFLEDWDKIGEIL